MWFKKRKSFLDIKCKKNFKYSFYLSVYNCCIMFRNGFYYIGPNQTKLLLILRIISYIKWKKKLLYSLQFEWWIERRFYNPQVILNSIKICAHKKIYPTYNMNLVVVWNAPVSSCLFFHSKPHSLTFGPIIHNCICLYLFKTKNNSANNKYNLINSISPFLDSHINGRETSILKRINSISCFNMLVTAFAHIRYDKVER